MVYHLGGGYTNINQITSSLKKNPEFLHDNGVLIRRPNRYRNILNSIVENLPEDGATHEQQERILTQVVKGKKVNRLIFANDNFMGVPALMLQGGALYQNAGSMASKLRMLFPNNPCEYFLAIRNPASLIPEAMTAPLGNQFCETIRDIGLKGISWASVISRIQEANPDCRITVWCHEDAPVTWPSVLRKIAGISRSAPLKGDLDAIQGVMEPGGLEILKNYLEKWPQLNESQRRRVKIAFLDKYLIEKSIIDETMIPCWNKDIAASLTEVYERDVGFIEKMPGICFISS